MMLHHRYLRIPVLVLSVGFPVPYYVSIVELPSPSFHGGGDEKVKQRQSVLR